MDKNKQIISVALGALVVVGAFLSVFGPILKNLTVEDVESEASLTADVSAPVTTAVNEQVPKVVPKTNTNSTSPVPVTTVSAYTFADVSNHNSATSCWSAVNGNVYDLTSWVNAHPGGRAAILMICGKDGSPLFNTQHGGEGKPASILAKYKIGSLKA